VHLPLGGRLVVGRRDGPPRRAVLRSWVQSGAGPDVAPMWESGHVGVNSPPNDKRAGRLPASGGAEGDQGPFYGSRQAGRPHDCGNRRDGRCSTRQAARNGKSQAETPVPPNSRRRPPLQVGHGLQRRGHAESRPSEGTRREAESEPPGKPMTQNFSEVSNWKPSELRLFTPNEPTSMVGSAPYRSSTTAATPTFHQSRRL